MNCTVDQRERIRAARDRVETREPVLAADVPDPHTDPTARWTLELVLCEDADGVPHQVLDDLGSYGLTLRNVDPQGTGWIAVATA